MSTVARPLDERPQPFDASPYRRRLGRLLQVQRDRLRLTQEEVAAHLRVSRSALSNLENGKSVPHLDVLLHLCHLLKLPGWVLLPPPLGSAAASLLPIIAQLADEEQRALVTVLGAQVSPCLVPVRVAGRPPVGVNLRRFGLPFPRSVRYYRPIALDTVARCSMGGTVHGADRHREPRTPCWCASFDR